jgi:Ca2+-transporting ATPase
MQRKPRDPRTGIFTRPVVTLMLAGGIWSTGVNLGLFVWGLGSGRSAEEARTMTFVSLVLIQFVKAYNFRSDRLSLLCRPFANKWLNLAILFDLALLALVVHLPVLHKPFGTYALPLRDWVMVAVVALTVAPVLEFVKWMVRRGWLGRLS